MALPNSKQELADWILRRLGAPLVNVELTDVQLEDCIDEAVQFYQNWHYDGAQRGYRVIKVDENMLKRNGVIPSSATAPDYDPTKDYDSDSRVMYQIPNDTVQGKRIWIAKKKITKGNPPKDSDKDNWILEGKVATKATRDVTVTGAGQLGIKIPDNIIGIVRAARVNTFDALGMWNYEYQYFLTNFDWFFGKGAGSGTLTNYYITRTHLDLIEQTFNVSPTIHFHKQRQQLIIDINWKRLVGEYILLEVYEVNDPEIYGRIYEDMWLKRYALSLAKMQWGSNLKKYTGTELPGGVQIDGQAWYEEGKEERQTLEEEMRTTSLDMDSIVLG